MNEEYRTVSNLTGRASRVLLLLLLARGLQVRQSQASSQPEFATGLGLWSGLSGESIPLALTELEEAGLIEIITYSTSSVQGRLQAAGVTPEKPEPNQADEDSPKRVDVREACRLADTNGSKQAQIAALMRVWDEAFPVSAYPAQRMTDDMALRFLANGRGAEEVGVFILDAVSRATERIGSPRAYITAALANLDKRKAAVPSSGELEITDELRKLTEMGRRQFSGRHKSA